MAKYYNAEKLLEFVKQNTPHIDGETTMECVERAIKEAPTADVVEVVRCKDCRYFTKGTLGEICKVYSTNQIERIVQKDHFCSYGEKRSSI